MGNYVMIIDRGSTNIKTILFDKNGNEVATYAKSSPGLVAIHPGWWEQDMDQIWEYTVESIQTVFKNGYQPEDIMSVFVIGQGNGLLAIDREGVPVRMGIHSLDSRSAGILSAWQSDGRYAKAIEQVRMPINAGSPLPILAWLKENAREEFDRIDKCFYTKDWIRYKLSGTLCTDPTDTGGSGLLDMKTGRYAVETFHMLGLDEIEEKLPPVYLPYEVVGKVTFQAAAETGLKEGTPVLCGAHDMGVFPFGVGSLDPRQMVSIIGTWGINLMPVTETEGLPTVIPHSIPGYYLTGMGDGNSGGCLEIMLQTLCEKEKEDAKKQNTTVYELVEKMIAESKPNGIVFQPFLFGNLFNAAASAGLYGLKNWHTKGDILRAVYEGIVMGHYANSRIIPGYEKLECIWLVGGGSKSKIFGQMFADITGLPIKVPKTGEITARGGALLSLMGLGIYKDYKEACIEPEISNVYMPNPEMRTYYDKKFEIFNDIAMNNVTIWNKLDSMER